MTFQANPQPLLSGNKRVPRKPPILKGFSTLKTVTNLLQTPL